MPNQKGIMLGIEATTSNKPPLDSYDKLYRDGLLTKAEAHEARTRAQKKAKGEKERQKAINAKKEQEKQEIRRKQKAANMLKKEEKQEEQTRKAQKQEDVNALWDAWPEAEDRKYTQQQGQKTTKLQRLQKQQEQREEQESMIRFKEEQEKADDERYLVQLKQNLKTMALKEKQKQEEQTRDQAAPAAIQAVEQDMAKRVHVTLENCTAGQEGKEHILRVSTNTTGSQSFESCVEHQSSIQKEVRTARNRRRKARKAADRLVFRADREQQTIRQLADIQHPQSNTLFHTNLYETLQAPQSAEPYSEHILGYSKEALTGHSPGSSSPSAEGNHHVGVHETAKTNIGANAEYGLLEDAVCGANEPVVHKGKQENASVCPVNGVNTNQSINIDNMHGIPETVKDFTLCNLSSMALPTTVGSIIKTTLLPAAQSSLHRLIDYNSSSEIFEIPTIEVMEKTYSEMKAGWQTMLEPAGSGLSAGQSHPYLEEIRTTPVFSASVLRESLQMIHVDFEAELILPQFGLLGSGASSASNGNSQSPGEQLMTFSNSSTLLDDIPVQAQATSSKPGSFNLADENIFFVNNNAPWSAFICGSQGSGKSYTLSCMLESALQASEAGPLPAPLTGIVFHYAGGSSTQPCEAAYLASKIPVRVLVSKSNLTHMEHLYSNLPGIDEKIEVRPVVFGDQHLDIEKMKGLMAIQDSAGTTPLYLENLYRILREMAIQRQTSKEMFSFAKFEALLGKEKWDVQQKRMLDMRLGLLKSFMATSKKEAREAWDFKPGTLTIIDLSDAFVDPRSASALFEMCLKTVLTTVPESQGKIIALDEAHKFMSPEEADRGLTGELLNTIRLQRHLGTRIIISTQEPTISPQLLDLASFTMIHRFTSPAWMTTLSSHLAGASKWDMGDTTRDVREMFKTIVDLGVGEALLFSPTAMVGVTGERRGSVPVMERLGMGFLKVKVRSRWTSDGGKSVLASGKR